MNILIKKIRHDLMSEILSESSEIKNGDRIHKTYGGDISLYRQIRYHEKDELLVSIIRNNEFSIVGIYVSPIFMATNTQTIFSRCGFLGTKSLDGGVVMIGGTADRIGITVKVKDAIKLAAITRMPVWATCDVFSGSFWRPPKSVSSVVIFGCDNGDFSSGYECYSLARSLYDIGIEIIVDLNILT